MLMKLKFEMKNKYLLYNRNFKMEKKNIQEI